MIEVILSIATDGSYQKQSKIWVPTLRVWIKTVEFNQNVNFESSAIV